MPRGRYPREYFATPAQAKPIEEIYRDLDGFTFEILPDEPEAFGRIAFVVVVPPVVYEGRFLKGLFFSQGVDVLQAEFPALADLFHSLAWTMWSSFPWSSSADGLLTIYDNHERERWFDRRRPGDRRPRIPLANPDFTHEYLMAPVPVPAKDIDVLCVSRLHDVKNVPMLAKALRTYRRKYGRAIRMTLVLGKRGTAGLDNLTAHEAQQWRQVEAILGRPEDYLEVVGHVEHRDLVKYYCRARVVVLGALLEGKSRVLSEAMACDTPVVCFEEFNRYARNGSDAIPAGAGLYASFDAESLADTLAAVLADGGDFTPRHSYLRSSGRMRFVNRCLDALPYYRSELPEFEPNAHDRNVWLDLAVQHTYGRSFHDFVYQSDGPLHRTHGVKGVARAIDYLARQLAL